MNRITSDAIILHSIDFLESDKIVCALTKEKGIVHAIAKGAKRSKKRFPGTLEPFCEVSMEIFVKREGDLHLGIREDLELLAHASVLLELVKEHLGPMDPSPATYELLRSALKAMEPERQWFSVWAVALMNILSSLGYGIDLGRSGKTGAPRSVPANMLSKEAATFLLNASRLDGEVLQRLSVKASLKREITSFLLAVCNKVSEKRLKTVSFLAKLLDFDLNQ
jgi:DNA repair protein RecO (recombination protein O)